MTTPDPKYKDTNIEAFQTSQNAALALSQSSYAGTVEPANSGEEIESFSTSSEAAMSLSQATYTGTVEPALAD